VTSAIFAGVGFSQLAVMRDQSAANQKSADAAKTSADTAYAQIRPWVALDRLVFTDTDPATPITKAATRLTIVTHWIVSKRMIRRNAARHRILLLA